jgi:hypothetical protein
MGEICRSLEMVIGEDTSSQPLVGEGTSSQPKRKAVRKMTSNKKKA